MQIATSVIIDLAYTDQQITYRMDHLYRRYVLPIM